MFNKENIIELIRQGEGYYLEFKESLNKDIPKEICAFANSAGGTLIIGVNDQNQIVGTRYDNKIASQLQNQLDTIDPHLDVTIESFDIDAKIVVVITCKTGPQKPHTYGGSIYIRQGPNTQKITSQSEMVDLFQKSDRVFFDENSCSRFNFPADFDELRFHEFQKAAGISNILDMDVILDNLQLVSENGHFKNASVLFFSRDPQKFFPQAVIRCVRFRGLDKSTILDTKEIKGTIQDQFTESWTISGTNSS
jgi:ATP-dependent DNA helicase RecG